MNPLVIYHKDCFDGFTAAWAFQQLVGGPIEYHAALYGSDPPDVSRRNVWILDFSYPRAVMEQIVAACRSLHVFDHHKTAEAALDGLVVPDGEVVFDMERSGAGITFDVLSDGRDRPWLINYVEDRDLWRRALPNSDLVSAWIAAQPMTFGAWDQLYDEGENAAISSGIAVQKYIAQYGRKARAEMRSETIAGHIVPTMNLPYMNCSEHIGVLLKEALDRSAPFAAGYFRRRDGRWQFSLRSGPDFDVSEVAKQFGGGGHAGAAGFEVEVLPWEAER